MREKQIFLSKLPSGRPLTSVESEERKKVVKNARMSYRSDEKAMLEDLAVQATAAAEANDHGLVYRFVKRPRVLKLH